MAPLNADCLQLQKQGWNGASLQPFLRFQCVLSRSERYMHALNMCVKGLEHKSDEEQGKELWLFTLRVV